MDKCINRSLEQPNHNTSISQRGLNVKWNYCCSWWITCGVVWITLALWMVGMPHLWIEWDLFTSYPHILGAGTCVLRGYASESAEPTGTDGEAVKKRGQGTCPSPSTPIDKRMNS